MSKVYITNEPDLAMVVDRELRPYYEAQEGACKLALDFETSTLMDNRIEELYKVPQPIACPPRAVCSLFDRKEFLMEREGFSSLLQIGADPMKYDRQWIIDVKKIDRKVVGDYVREYLEGSLIIGHSLRYEVGWCEEEFDIFLDPRKILDIRLIDQCLIAGSNCSTGLGDAYKRYLSWNFFIEQTKRKLPDGTYSKGMTVVEYEDFKDSMQKSEWAGEHSEEQLWYAADDVRLPFFVYDAQKDAIRKHYKKHPKSHILQRIKDECALVPEASRIFLRGVRLDLQYHNNEVIPYLEKKKEEEYAKAAAICPNPNPFKVKGEGRGAKRVFWEAQELINFRSPAQVIQSLKILGIKVPNTEEKTLKENREKHPAIEYILRYRKAASMLSKYGYTLPKFVHENGKLHPDFGQIGTETSRFAYWKPPLQTIPNKEKLFREKNAGELFRTGFTADSEEYEIVDADLPNIEPRLITQSSQERRLIEAFCANVDYHGLTAKILMDLEELPLKGSWHREKIGKIGNLSLGYGASWKTLKENMLKYTIDDDDPIRWSDEYAKLKYQAYFDALPAVAAKIAEITARVEKAFSCHDTLLDFAGQKPIFEIFSEWPKTPDRSHMCYRSFYLMDWHEELARKVTLVTDPRKHPLHKNYQVIEPVLDEDGRPVLDELGQPKLKKHFYNAYARLKNDIAREAYNFMIQAEGALVLKRIMLMVSSRLRDAGFPKNEGILLTVHDEILLHVHKSRVALAKQILKECMEECCREVIVDVPIECKPNSGPNWAEAA